MENQRAIDKKGDQKNGTTSTAEVLKRHSSCFRKGDLSGLLSDYDTEANLFTPNGVLRGLTAIRDFFAALLQEFGKPGTSFERLRQEIEGETAYSIWSAETAENHYEFATDTYVVQNGKIVTQTFAGKISPKRRLSHSELNTVVRQEGLDDRTLVKSSFSAVINAPIKKVDIPSWCFTLPESEYQACSPAHCSAGATTSPDGRRMSINVEIIGGSLMVQHYVEEIGQPDHLQLVSNSDVFTPTGRTKIGVIWDLSVKKIDDETCEFTNMVHSSATPELLDFLGKQGIPVEVFRTARKPFSEAHNRQETPLFAKSIERHALSHKQF
jgi:hypothetical protein